MGNPCTGIIPVEKNDRRGKRMKIKKMRFLILAVLILLSGYGPFHAVTGYVPD